MEKEHRIRLEKVKNKWWDSDFIKDYYGLDLEKIQDTELFKVMVGWIKNQDLEFIRDNFYNRYALEKYFFESELIPIKFAAIELGMAEESFRKVMDEMTKRAIYPRLTWNFEGELIPSSIIQDFRKFYKDTRNSVFKDTQDFLRKLHQAIQKELNIKVEPLYCYVSEFLEEQPKLIASDFCILSLKPISCQHRIWLYFRKPGYLEMDYCSSKLYVEDLLNEGHLKYFIFGKPDDSIDDSIIEKLKSKVENKQIDLDKLRNLYELTNTEHGFSHPADKVVQTILEENPELIQNWIYEFWGDEWICNLIFSINHISDNKPELITKEIRLGIRSLLLSKSFGIQDEAIRFFEHCGLIDDISALEQTKKLTEDKSIHKYINTVIEYIREMNFKKEKNE